MFTVPELPYDYNALDPYIDEVTMHLHHDKHHVAYVNNLNTSLKDSPDWQEKSIEEILINLKDVPEIVRTAVQNNGGGHYNHSLFWTIMKSGGSQPEGKLLEAINSDLGSLEKFQEAITNAGMTQFGSGWAWLVVNPSTSSGQVKLEVVKTANQDSPLSIGKTPIFGIDVWEHAYYLKYRNMRADYISAFWNIVNWSEVGRRFEEAMK